MAALKCWCFVLHTMSTFKNSHARYGQYFVYTKPKVGLHGLPGAELWAIKAFDSFLSGNRPCRDSCFTLRYTIPPMFQAARLKTYLYKKDCSVKLNFAYSENPISCEWRIGIWVGCWKKKDMPFTRPKNQTSLHARRCKQEWKLPLSSGHLSTQILSEQSSLRS